MLGSSDTTTFEAQLRSAVASGDEDLRHDFVSEHGVWFGFRAQPGAVAEEIAACLESRYGERGLSAEATSNGLLLHFGSKTVQVPSQRRYRQCFAELRALNQVLSPGYEIRLVADSVSEEEEAHAFVIASTQHWQTAAHNNLDSVYAPITRKTDFALGPFPSLTVWLAERAVALLVRLVLGRHR